MTRISLAVIAAVVAVASACGQSEVQKAENAANQATCDSAYTMTIAALTGIRVHMISGRGLSKAVVNAQRFVDHEQAILAGDPTCRFSDQEKARLRHDIGLLRCDLSVAAEGRFCPGQM